MSVEREKDEDLMTRLASGEKSCLAELIHRHQEKAMRLAYRVLGNWADAEDIAQQAFIRVFRSAGKFGGKSTFSTWFYRIIVNLCIDHRRRHKRRLVPLEVIEDQPSNDPDSDNLAKQEIAGAVRRAVHKLPERQRIAVVLHRFENLSHEQISDATGWSKSAVESLLVRAYAKLRKNLQRFDDVTQE